MSVRRIPHETGAGGWNLQEGGEEGEDCGELQRPEASDRDHDGHTGVDLGLYSSTRCRNMNLNNLFITLNFYIKFNINSRYLVFRILI